MKLVNKGGANVAIKPKRNIGTAIIIGIAIIVVSIIIFVILNKVLAKESYYVLNQDIPAKTQVNETMLKEVVTSEGTSPQNAINIQQVRQGSVYTKIPLKSGDILSASNTGINLDASTGIPDDWVVTSFPIDPKDAVAGYVRKGDYFDIIGVDDENGSKYLFLNVLALDVVYEGSGYKEFNEAATSDTSELEGVQYVIGMPSADAAKLHYALAKYEKVKMVLSPASLTYKYRDVSDLEEPFFVDNDTIPSDLFDGTDAAFTPVLRDDNGRPVNHKNCKADKITPKELCDQLPEEVTEEEEFKRDGEEDKPSEGELEEQEKEEKKRRKEMSDLFKQKKEEREDKEASKLENKEEKDNKEEDKEVDKETTEEE